MTIAFENTYANLPKSFFTEQSPTPVGKPSTILINEKLAEFFSKISKFLIIEFVPKSDSQVKRLLLTREDIFENYDEKNFETEFIKFFKIINSKKISDSERTIYIMEKLTNSE